MEITHFFEALWQLTLSMAPYILFGLLFAGVLHALVPESIVTKHLGKENIASVIKATIFGIPLPVCSCGVIPLATAIKKSGASKGATLSFLISTPITGVDSILATYGIFGWIFTLYRIITSMIIAIVAGILTNIFDKEKKEPQSNKPLFSTTTTNTLTATMPLQKKEAMQDTTSTDECCSNENTSKKFSLKAVFDYAFNTLLKDIAKPLFWGLILGALITVAIPDNLSELLKDNAWLSYLIVILIAVPMYVCATASLPIAAGLMLSGVSAGAAFVFLTAGPATNTVTIGVVKKMLGSTSLATYLGSIVVGSILFGFGLDYIFDISNINPSSLIHLDEDNGIIATLSAIILWGFILWFTLQPYFQKKDSCTGGGCCS
ncbi:MAG: permease [Sulfurovum sp.]|nr:MAG: permease [Sulfurovum sp.]